MALKRTITSFILAIAHLNVTTFTLTEDEVSIGRALSNRIIIGDGLVSWRHCLIKREAGQYKITDLDSRHGTLVNDVPTKEQFLKPGDRIRVGRSLLLFLQREDEARPIMHLFRQQARRSSLPCAESNQFP